MIGKWEGSGTFEVTGIGFGPVLAVAAIVVMASAVAAIIAAIFWILVAVAVVLVAAAVLLGLAIRRKWAGSSPFAGPVQFFAEPVRPQATAAAPPAVVNHYHGGSHLHIEAGTDPALINRSILEGTRYEPEAR